MKLQLLMASQPPCCNANEAIAAADSRKVNLANVMNQKGCQIPGFSPIAPVSPVASK